MTTLNDAINAYNELIKDYTDEHPPLVVLRNYLVKQQGVESRRGTDLEYLDREAAVVESLRQRGL